MGRLIESLVRYSKATNIPLQVENGNIDLDAFFLEAHTRGYLSLESIEEIRGVLE